MPLCYRFVWAPYSGCATQPQGAAQGALLCTAADGGPAQHFRNNEHRKSCEPTRSSSMLTDELTCLAGLQMARRRQMLRAMRRCQRRRRMTSSGRCKHRCAESREHATCPFNTGQKATDNQLQYVYKVLQLYNMNAGV